MSVSRPKGTQYAVMPGTPPLALHRSTFELIVEPRDSIPIWTLGILWLALSAGFAAVLAIRVPLLGAVVGGCASGAIISTFGLLVHITHVKSHSRLGPYLHANLPARSVRLGHARRDFTVDQITAIVWASGIIKSSPYHDHYEPRSWVFIDSPHTDTSTLSLVCMNPRTRGGAKTLAHAIATFLDKPCRRIELKDAVAASDPAT